MAKGKWQRYRSGTLSAANGVSVVELPLNVQRYHWNLFRGVYVSEGSGAGINLINSNLFLDNSRRGG